ncbi:MAG: hypothetical protein M1142_04105 [Patescibacteria group bacterium]|nr:hypothetical protein [Patescibacteria group bacterium]
MTDDELKNLKKLLKESLQPLQGEVSRLTTETRNLSSRMLRIESGTSQNTREIARLSSDMENMKDWLGEEMGQINNKLDALLSDVVDLQTNVGVIQDQLVDVKENKKDIRTIKKHLRLPPN